MKVEKAEESLTKIKKYLTRNKPRFEVIKKVDLLTDKIISSAYFAVQSSEKLIQCTPQSIVKATIEASQLGLYIDGILGHAFLIPFKGKCQLVPGYKGYRKLILASGKIKQIMPYVVYEGDEFRFNYGLNSDINHTPLETSDKIIACYVIITYKDGSKDFRVFFQREIDKARSYSKTATYEDSVWAQHPDKMWEKTAIKRMASYLDLGDDLTKAVGLENTVEAGKLQINDIDIIDCDFEELPAGEESRKNKEISTPEKKGVSNLVR